jgi:hypothetical protein
VALLHEECAEELAVGAGEILGSVDALNGGEFEEGVDFWRGKTVLVFVLERFLVEGKDVLTLLVVETGFGFVAESS